jgi:hypothetical protein
VKTAYHSLSHLQVELTRGDGPQFLRRTGKKPTNCRYLAGVVLSNRWIMKVTPGGTLASPGRLVKRRGLSPEVHCVMTPDLALSTIAALLLIAAFVSVPLDDVIEPILARFR